LFFVISGFIMVYTSEALFGRLDAPGRFLGRRLLRIAPLYWGLTTLSLIGWHLGRPFIDATWINVVGSYLFIPFARPSGSTEPILGVGWTLNYEMFFYALFSIAVLLPRVAAVGALCVAIWLVIAFPPSLTPWAVLCNSFLGEFAFGMLIALLFRQDWRLPPIAGAILIIAGVALLILTDRDQFVHVSRVAGWGGGSAMILAGTALGKASFPRFLGPIAYLGDSSYALYLGHPFVPIALSALPISGVIDPSKFPLVLCAAIVSVSVASSLVLSWVDGRIRSWIVSCQSVLSPARVQVAKAPPL
jgi:exopolysaccharide production protein ExoZ